MSAYTIQYLEQRWSIDYEDGPGVSTALVAQIIAVTDPEQLAEAIAAYLAENPPGGAVDSVNGQTGVVELGAADVGAVADDDSRLSDSRTPTAHTHTASDVTTGLAAVATSGDYGDLSGKPTIPDSADGIGAAPATRTVGTGLGTSGTVDLDMSALHGTIQTITLTGTTTFTTSNKAAGREVTLVLAAGGSSRTLAWPSWTAVGAALPTTLASGKTLVVTVTFTGTAEASGIAAAAAQT